MLHSTVSLVRTASISLSFVIDTSGRMFIYLFIYLFIYFHRLFNNLSVSEILWRRMIGWLMIWNEFYLELESEVLFRPSPGGTEKYHDKTSCKVINVPVKIRTSHFPYTSQKPYRLTEVP
jgi:hypothetical protein